MIKVLSLFDGIAGARQALKELNIDCEYYASEIDKYAIQVAKNNHPNIIQLGDVNNIKFKDFVGVDLLIGGFPCQDLSIAKRDGKGLEGARSGLFSKCLEALEICKPKYFLFENVNSMKKEWKDKISKLLGVEPIMINSALLTAQMRKRLYWTNIPNIQQPEDKGIVLKDIIESEDTEKLKSYCITATYSRACPKDYFNHGQRQLIFKSSVKVGTIGKGGQGDRIYSIDAKSVCLSANGGGRGAKTGLYEIKDIVRKLTPIECERLQGFLDNYSEGASNTQRYKALGNSFTVPVIKHILQNLFLEV
jgi:DNA (cytosine-5)-methyltransferase 3A